MSSKSVGKPLTTELVFTKTKSDSLHNIKNLNLWGNDLQDLSLIEHMPNLQVISLSVNKIASLKYFGNCQKLQELYLRKNNVADISQIRYLVNLPCLKVLWLHDNPCAQIEHYREIVIKCLPNLMKLDNNPVTTEEKQASKNVGYSLENNENNFKSEKLSVEYSQEKKGSKGEQSYPQTQKGDDAHQEPNHYIEKLFKKGGNQAGKKNNYHENKEEDEKRNQNILMAVLSLMRELDSDCLEIIRREAEKLQQGQH